MQDALPGSWTLPVKEATSVRAGRVGQLTRQRKKIAKKLIAKQRHLPDDAWA
jgi:hypothetical protein